MSHSLLFLLDYLLHISGQRTILSGMYKGMCYCTILLKITAIHFFVYIIHKIRLPSAPLYFAYWPGNQAPAASCGATCKAEDNEYASVLNKRQRTSARVLVVHPARCKSTHENYGTCQGQI